MPTEVNKIFIAPDTEKLAKNYDTSCNLPAVQMDKANLSLENASPTDIPHLEPNLMSLLEFTPDKVIKLQKNDTFCKNILEYIHCSKNDNYFIDAKGILHKKVINFNSTFTAVVVPRILIKYLLHVSHDSLGHTGGIKLYYFIKRLYYFQGMIKKIHQYVRSRHKCQMMNLQKPHLINLHQDIAKTPQDHISIDLLGHYNVTSQSNSYALTTVCNLTGYLMTSPIKDKKTTTVVTHLFSDIMLKFGFPRILHSENGSEFKSKLIEHLSQQLGIKKTYIPLVTLKLMEK